MTVEQLVILAIVGAAFVAGWVARDPKGHPLAGDPEPREPSDADLQALEAVTSAYVAASDAWADGEDTDAAVAALAQRIGDLRTAVGTLPAGPFSDAVASLEIAAAVIATHRGRPLDRSTSGLLDDLEARISTALGALGAARLD